MKEQTTMPNKLPKLEGCSYTDNLSTVKQQISSAASAARRSPAEISLVAVSKTFQADRIKPILASGHLFFGENRVQEAIEKWSPLKLRHPNVRLHLIGSLQSNKVSEAMALFDVIETLDRPKLAQAIARERDRTTQCPSLLIQVNTGEEPQKGGVLPDRIDDFIERCQTEFDLTVRGLMCIPPLGEEPSLHFGLLREIGRRHDVERFSMGMSNDFEIAIRFGATHVRIGTAIFGQRGLGDSQI